MMRALLAGVGALVLVAGLLFLAQGTGLFPYPRSSFMIGAHAWVWRGAALAVLGGVLILLSRSVGVR